MGVYSFTLSTVHSRNKAFLKYRRMKDPGDFDNYKVLRNLVQDKIKVAKSTFIKDQLTGKNEEPKALWKVLPKILPMGKSEPNPINIGLDVKIGKSRLVS